MRELARFPSGWTANGMLDIGAAETSTTTAQDVSTTLDIGVRDIMFISEGKGV